MGLFDGIANFFTGEEDNATYNKYKDLLGNIVGSASSGMQPYLDNPGYQVAPMNDWQNQAGNAALGMLGQGSAGSYASQIAGAGDGVSVADIMGYANPLADSLNQAGQHQLDTSFARSSSDIGNRAAASGAFGGSREAVQRGMLDENMLNATNQMTAGNEATAYQLGSGLATGNADRNLNALLGADSSRLAGLGYDASAAGLLGSFGDQRQGYQQSVNDAPYTTATQLLGLLSGNQPTEQASGFQTLLGYLLSGAGNASRAFGG